MSATCKECGSPVPMVRFLSGLYIQELEPTTQLPGDLPKERENIKKNVLTICGVDQGSVILKVNNKYKEK